MPNLDVSIKGYLNVPNGCALTGPLENELTLPCGKVLKFWLGVELVSDPAAPDADPRDLDSAELAKLGVTGPEYDESAVLCLDPDGLDPAKLPKLVAAARAMLRDQALTDTEEQGLNLLEQTKAVSDEGSSLEALLALEQRLAPLTAEQVAVLATCPEDCPPELAEVAQHVTAFFDEMYTTLLT